MCPPAGQQLSLLCAAAVKHCLFDLTNVLLQKLVCSVPGGRKRQNSGTVVVISEQEGSMCTAAVSYRFKPELV